MRSDRSRCGSSQSSRAKGDAAQRYLVEVTRDVRIFATVEVTATSESDAKIRALEVADAPNSREWSDDEVIDQRFQVRVQEDES